MTATRCPGRNGSMQCILDLPHSGVCVFGWREDGATVVRRLIAAMQAILGDRPDRWGYHAAANVLDDDVRREAEVALTLALGLPLPEPAAAPDPVASDLASLQQALCAALGYVSVWRANVAGDHWFLERPGAAPYTTEVVPLTRHAVVSHIFSGDDDEHWFRTFAREHDRLAAFVREHFPGEPDCGTPTRRESVFDDVLRLLARTPRAPSSESAP